MISGPGTAIISAIIIGGSAITVFYLEKRRKRRSLRLALKTEIEENSIVVSILSDGVIDFTEPQNQEILDTADTTIYESAAEDLGLLTSSEAYAVTRYYSYLKKVLRITRMSINSGGERSVQLDDIAEDLEIIEGAAIEILDDPPGYLDNSPSIIRNRSDDFDTIDGRFKRNVTRELRSRGDSVTADEWEDRKQERTKYAIEQISEFNANVNYFTPGRETLFGTPIQDIFQQATEDLEDDNISWNIQSDVLTRMTETDTILTSPIWIFHQGCLLDNNIYELIEPKLAHAPIPLQTHVIVHLKNTNKEDVVLDRMERIFSAYRIATTKTELMMYLRSYFKMMEPISTPARERIAEWNEMADRFSNQYD